MAMSRLGYGWVWIWLCVIGCSPSVFASEPDLQYNIVRLEAKATRAVDNDLMHASLRLELEDKSPAALATRINEVMQWALAKARTSAKVEIDSGNYQTYPVHKNQTFSHWRGYQELHLQSAAVKELTELVGQLQEKMQIQQMRFSISKSLRRKVEDELIQEALTAFQKRADIIRTHLDFSSYRIVETSVDFSSDTAPPGRHYAARLAVAEMATQPDVEQGTGEVTVSVRGSIQLWAQ